VSFDSKANSFLRVPKTKTATAQCQSDGGRFQKNLKALFYAISLHAPIRPERGNVDICCSGAREVGA
jgi:hypothetical protein